MSIRVEPVILEREKLIARVVDADGGYVKAETWTGREWRGASSLLFPEIFASRPATHAELQARGVPALGGQEMSRVD